MRHVPGPSQWGFCALGQPPVGSLGKVLPEPLLWAWTCPRCLTRNSFHPSSVLEDLDVLDKDAQPR